MSVGRRIFPLVWTFAAACCPDSTYDQIFLIRNPDATTQALIDACRDPVHPDCVPLCSRLTQAGTLFDHCEMHPDKEGYTLVHVKSKHPCL